MNDHVKRLQAEIDKVKGFKSEVSGVLTIHSSTIVEIQADVQKRMT